MEGNREDRAILAQVRAFFESHGASRFDNIRAPNNERIQNRAGFYSTDDAGFRVYMVLTEVFKKELCQGFEPRAVARVLMNEGWLKPATDGMPTHKPRVKGVGHPESMYLRIKFGVENKTLEICPVIFKLWDILGRRKARIWRDYFLPLFSYLRS